MQILIADYSGDNDSETTGGWDCGPDCETGEAYYVG